MQAHEEAAVSLRRRWLRFKERLLQSMSGMNKLRTGQRSIVPLRRTKTTRTTTLFLSKRGFGK